MSRKSDFAYRQAVAKRVAQRDRSRGLSRHDAASQWLRLNPDERKRFARWFAPRPTLRRGKTRTRDGRGEHRPNHRHEHSA